MKFENKGLAEIQQHLISEVAKMRLQNKELNQHKKLLKAEVAELNATLTKLHHSYETAFEEKMAKLHKYVQELEHQVRIHSLVDIPQLSHTDLHASAAAPDVRHHTYPPSSTTAVSPQVFLTSSLTTLLLLL